jgi:glycosyltransferase involved in cell wall biosynthesis
MSYVLSVIIPVFNEIKTLEMIVDRTLSVPLPRDGRMEVILVDDGSSDGTRDLYPKLRDRVSKVVLHKKNKGKGAAIRTGMKHATGDYLVIQDADLEYDPMEYARLLHPILDDRADVVYGSRFLGGGEHRVLYFWHRVGNGVLTMLSNMFTNINLSDMETCYKVFRRSVLEGIEVEEDRFGFEPEITCKLAKRHIRFYEIGITYHGRTYEEGKKIGLKDAFRALYCIIRYSVFHRDTPWSGQRRG